MKSVCAAILCAGLTASTMCRAADDNDLFLVWGVGGSSCNTYLDARAANGAKQESFTSYLMGYITAYNVLVPNTYNIAGDMKADQMLLWLDGYCDDHKTGSFETAVHDLTASIAKKRQKSADDTPARWP
jgi:hypothetical protein